MSLPVDIKKVFPILALSVFSSTLGIGIVSPLLPLYVRSMGATSLWVGIIFAMYAVSNSIVTPIAGRVSDRKGRKSFLTVGLIAYAVISLGYVWANSLYLLAAVRFIQGAAGAITIPIAMAYVGDLAPEGKEGRWMAYANVAFFAGFGFGPLMGGLLTDHFGMNATFYSMSALNFVAAGIAAIFLPEAGVRRVREAGTLLASFKEIGSSRIIRGLFIFRATESLGRGGIGAFIPIFAANVGLSTSLVGALLTINMLSVNLVMPLGGYVADRFDRRTVLIIGSAIGAGLLAAITLAHSFGQLVIFMALQAVGVAVAMPAASAIIVEEGRKFGMASTMSAFFVAMGVGMAIGPVISGQIADAVSVNWVFYFGTIMGLAGTVLFAALTRGYRSHPGTEVENDGAGAGGRVL